jgi:hypothetical protein
MHSKRSLSARHLVITDKVPSLGSVRVHRIAAAGAGEQVRRPPQRLLRFTCFYWLLLSYRQYAWKFFIAERFLGEPPERLFTNAGECCGRCCCSIVCMCVLVCDAT